MKRLLHRTMLYYASIASIVLLVSVPILYTTMLQLHYDDVDEAIWLRSEEFHQQSLPSLIPEDIPKWNKFNRDILLLPDTAKNLVTNSIHEQSFYDALVPEWEPYHVLYQKVQVQQQTFVLMIRNNLVESADLFKSILQVYAVLIFLMLTVIILLTQVLSKKIWRPFYKTLDFLEQFNIDHPQNSSFPATHTKEFQQLHSYLKKLIDNAVIAYQRQKLFTQNAAHELQTPLAIFQAKLDMLLQEPSLTTHQSSLLKDLYEASARLNRITKNLLLLAKIENQQFPIKTSVNINELIVQALAFFELLAQQKKITIDYKHQGSPTISANIALIEIIINNLLLNAIKYNKHEGAIRLELTDHSLAIANTSDLPGLQKNLVGQRFVNMGQPQNSSGLGLAIVKEITDRYGWQLIYEHQPGWHIFKILLK